MNRSIKRLVTVCSSLGLATLGLAAAAVPTVSFAQQDQSATLNQAVGALRAISTMRADFVQTDRDGHVMRGVLTLKRPGKIRFQYEKGIPLLIVSDGKALTMIDYQVRQVQRWPIGNSPLGALLNPNRDVSRFGRVQPTGNPNVISIEVRDRGHPEYGVITLIFIRKADAPGGWELTTWVALDSQNRRTTVHLSNQHYGIPVDENMFRYNDPRQPSHR